MIRLKRLVDTTTCVITDTYEIARRSYDIPECALVTPDVVGRVKYALDGEYKVVRIHLALCQRTLFNTHLKALRDALGNDYYIDAVPDRHMIEIYTEPAQSLAGFARCFVCEHNAQTDITTIWRREYLLDEAISERIVSFHYGEPDAPTMLEYIERDSLEANHVTFEQTIWV